MLQKKLASILKAQGSLREAVFYYDEALKSGGPKPDIYTELADVYETQGEPTKASYARDKAHQLEKTIQKGR